MQSTSLLYLEYSALGYRAMPQLFEGLSPLPFQALVTRCLLGSVTNEGTMVLPQDPSTFPSSGTS